MPEAETAMTALTGIPFLLPYAALNPPWCLFAEQNTLTLEPTPHQLQFR